MSRKSEHAMQGVPNSRSIGEKIINLIAYSALVDVKCEDDVERSHVFIWKANATEQLDALVRDHVEGIK